MTNLNAASAVTVFGIAVLGIGAVGCDRNTSPHTALFDASPTASLPAGSSGSHASASAQPFDYTRLLIRTGDILAPGDSYAAQPATLNPNGTQGAEVLFTNHDQTRAVGDSIIVLPDPAAAPGALQQAVTALGTSVTGADPQPAAVGAGGAVVSGMSPDQSKAVTILLFTEGRAFTRLEFDSAPGQSTPADFVTDTGQKQDIALRIGLA